MRWGIPMDYCDNIKVRLPNAYLVIMSENPSTHCAHEPDNPAMLYPRGGIRVWLWRVLARSRGELGSD